MNQYIIMGEGNSSPNVIEDSLADLPKPRTFHVSVEKTKKEGISRVYDWLLDNKETFVAYSSGDAPKILLDSASRVVNDEYTHIIMEEVAVSGKIPVLYLYDEDEDKGEGNVTNHIMSMIDRGIQVLDLTQGLAPFLIYEDKKEKVVNETVDALPPITRKEYEEMPNTALAQHAKAQGLDTSVPRDKLLDALLGESDSNEHSKNITAVVVVVYGDNTTKIVKSTKEHVDNLLKDL